jgi:hypothetical protein
MLEDPVREARNGASTPRVVRRLDVCPEGAA